MPHFVESRVPEMDLRLPGFGGPKGPAQAAQTFSFPVSFGAVLVKPLPIQTFGGDIVIPAASDVAIDVFNTLGGRCIGFLVVGVVGTVRVAINGGALRTVTSDLAVNDAYVNQVRVVTGAGSTAIVQLHGV